MKSLILMFAIVFLSASVATSQTMLGPVIGFDQHAAGGGPTLGIILQPKAFRMGLAVHTQINVTSLYRFQPFGEYRFASDAKQFFGGGFSFGYVFKHKTPQKVKPVLLYRSDYFHSRYGKNHIYIDDGGEPFRQFMYSVLPSFSTNQTIAAGITASFGKGFGLDFTMGAGVYIYKDFSYWSPNKNPEFVFMPPSKGVTICPDLNLNISFHYLLKVK